MKKVKKMERKQRKLKRTMKTELSRMKDNVFGDMNELAFWAESKLSNLKKSFSEEVKSLEGMTKETKEKMGKMEESSRKRLVWEDKVDSKFENVTGLVNLLFEDMYRMKMDVDTLYDFLDLDIEAEGDIQAESEDDEDEGDIREESEDDEDEGDFRAENGIDKADNPLVEGSAKADMRPAKDSNKDDIRYGS